MSQLREPAQSPKTKDRCPVPARAETSKFCEIWSCFGVCVVRSIVSTLDAERTTVLAPRR